MIGRRELPDNYVAWNKQWAAPYGRLRRLGTEYGRVVARVPVTRAMLGRRWPRLAGPFGLQDNNEIRAFEYPWAFFATPLTRGMTAIEVGGGLSGFQFVLERTGVEVTNVDPGDPSRPGWGATPRMIGRLNRVFRTSVRLAPQRIQDADLAEGTFDRVFSISTLEHIPSPEVYEVAEFIGRLLKPGGACVLTIDLFLDLQPFSSKPSNVYGTNVDVSALVKASGLELTSGDPRELHGFAEFDPDHVLRSLPDLFIGWGYPAVAQAVVLTKS